MFRVVHRSHFFVLHREEFELRTFWMVNGFIGANF